MAKKDISMDWATKCAQSNKTMFMCPPEIILEAEEMMKTSDEFIAKAAAFDKLSAEFDNYAKNFWHKMRTVLEKNPQIENIWGKNIGWNQRAKEDGIKVINITGAGAAPQGMKIG